MMHITIWPGVAFWTDPIPSYTPRPKPLIRYQQTREWGWRYSLPDPELQALTEPCFSADLIIYE